VNDILNISGHRTITPTSCNQCALLRCRADASTVATEGTTAALRLALVVLEEEEGIGAGLKLGAHHRFIRSIVLPLAY